MPKAPAPRKKYSKTRHDPIQHDPLHVQLKQDEVLETYGKVTRPGKRAKRTNKSDEENEEVLLDPKTSQRIFELAKDQQDELESLPDDDDGEFADETQEKYREQPRIDEDEEEEETFSEGSVDAEEYAEFEIDEGDIQTLGALLPSNAGERRTLADIIFSKLENQEQHGGLNIEAAPEQQQRQSTPDPAAGLNPKVVEVYTKVGLILSKYKSGPLPKAFKMIPSLPQWARIVALTNPTEWTPHATNAATRIFISNLKPDQARWFLEGVLLERVRTNMHEKHQGRKVDVHLYEALKKALYKPGAFFKGILFPLVQGGCTLKEAAIIASVLSNAKIPMLHSAAALARLASLPKYSGPSSLFIRVLLDKKYALPFQTLDLLVHYFVRISNTYKAGLGESEELPVLWHQSLLVFCQRFAPDLAPDQKDALLDVIRVHPHPQISLEIRRELINSVSRGEPRHDDGDVDMAT
ncbi:hypothetical protein M422DRAFT_216042 [Sphaerobolus stellatus SS14]|uniref:Bystin n=1 Tax=Sphaerobolus stellatus (strain SS14) TaxID=990650 RepID=A0A0C9UNE4_SPHS4|nr:hypothetical protein M422DRAFT_216042 [Sphaerobolus stellatus SS14]